MAYQSLYRRYRSQRWSELKGQDHVSQTLRNAVREGRVSHAYLFSGPRGTGKTSSARILAKALNCGNQADGEPCGTCDSCVGITEGRSLDVVELDAASNRGVDAMRELVSRASLGTPGRWKVYIVDEVHMLTTDASTTLLKTLEEPPGHVIFVLATTEPQKVLPTIRSRTQHFEFHLLPSDVLGVSIFNNKTQTFDFKPGPIFVNILLADEINRSPAKVQSALLEAMQEKQVTIEGETRALPAPFFVIATQNAVEMTGTYPLPEAQLDRFMFNVVVDYLPEDDEVAVVVDKEVGQDVDDDVGEGGEAAGLHEHDGAHAANRHPTTSRILINGEPTENRLALGSKGMLYLALEAEGRAAHSAYPELGDSAIEKLLDVLARLRTVPLHQGHRAANGELGETQPGGADPGLARGELRLGENLDVDGALAYDGRCRVNPPLPARDDALALLARPAETVEE